MRQFLAIDIPADLGKRLAEIGASAGRRWRGTRPEAIHLTLRFLGEVDEERDAPLREAWRLIAADTAPFSLELDGFGVFPARGRPRVYWIGARETPDRGLLMRLQGRLEEACRSRGFAPDRKKFSPHLTLARARAGAGAIATEPAWRPVRIQAGELTLFRSELLPQGARYTALEQFPFDALP